jgi:hypothetical protein
MRVNVLWDFFPTVLVDRKGHAFSPDFGENKRPFCCITTAETRERSFWVHCYLRPRNESVLRSSLSSSRVPGAPEALLYCLSTSPSCATLKENYPFAFSGVLPPEDRAAREGVGGSTAMLICRYTISRSSISWISDSHPFDTKTK